MVAIAAGGWHSLALVGNGPVPAKVLVTNPAKSTNGFSLSLPTLNGRVYSLEYKNTLTDTNWTTASLFAGTGGTRTLTDAHSTGAQRFYRVRQW